MGWSISNGLIGGVIIAYLFPVKSVLGGPPEVLQPKRRKGNRSTGRVEGQGFERVIVTEY